MPRSIFPKDQFQDTEGNALVGASVEIRRESDNTLATVYEARAGGGTIAQPLTTDGNGRIVAYLEAAPGGYRAVATLGSLVATRNHVAVGTVAEHDWPVAAADVTFPTGTGGIEEDNVLDAIVAAAGLGGGGGTLEVYDGAAEIDAAATRLVFDVGIGATALGSGVVRVDVQVAGEGSTYGLVHDGATDQTVALNAVLEANAGKLVRLLTPSSATGALRINATVDFPNGVNKTTLDISQIDIDLGKLGRIYPQGRIAETAPEKPRIQLAADALAGADTVFLNLVQADNGDELVVGGWLIFRDQKDVAGVAFNREFAQIAAIEVTAALTRTVTLTAELKNDFLVEYPLSDWVPGDGTDKTRISALVGSPLTANVALGDRVIPVADGAAFAAGQHVFLRSTAMVVPGDPGSIPYGEEPARVLSVDANNVTIAAPAGRPFLVADAATLFVVDTKAIEIIGGGKIRSVEEADEGRRIDVCGGQFLAQGWRIAGIRYDGAATGTDKRGGAVAVRRSNGGVIEHCDIRNRANTGAGDGNGLAPFYSIDCVVRLNRVERARHAAIIQGGTRNQIVSNQFTDNFVNGADFHGGGESYCTIAWNTFVGGDETAPDSSQQGGVTAGNTRWRGLGVGNIVIGNRFVGFDEGSNFGLAIRPPQLGFSAVANTFDNCATGVRVRIDDQAGAISIAGVALQANVFRDCATDTDIATNEAPAWAAGQTVLSATAIRPRYRTNAGNLYKTEAGGTTGATPPTHGSGSASDGTLTWTYVAAAANRITGFVDRDLAGGGSGDVTVQDLREWGSGTAVTVASSAGVITPVWATHFDNAQTVHLVRGAGDATAGPLLVRFPAFPGAGRAARTVQYEPTVATIATTPIAVAGVSYINSDGVAVLSEPAGDPGVFARHNIEEGDAIIGADFTGATVASIAGTVITANVAASQEATATVSFVVPGSTIDGQRRINLPERASGALFGMEAKALPTATALGVVQTTAGAGVTSDSAITTNGEAALFSGVAGGKVQALRDAYAFLSAQTAAAMVPMSQSDYDALTTEQKNTAGIVYLTFDDDVPVEVSNFMVYLQSGVQASNIDNHIVSEIDALEISDIDTLLIMSGGRGSTTYEPSSLAASGIVTLGALTNHFTQTHGTGADADNRQARATASAVPVTAVVAGDSFNLTVTNGGTQFQSGSLVLRLAGAYTVAGSHTATAAAGELVLTPVPVTTFAAGDVRVDLVVQTTGGATAIGVPAELQDITQSILAGGSNELRAAVGVTSASVATARTWTVSAAAASRSAGVSIVLRPTV